ncbi:dolichol-P-glucose transferase [Salinarchaeum sp. Harcht-Bsk1]|uniref:glycosyltransferase n=1 Tax=Salinarchaeum sp. Harcht-Bsk1 TaxID=1333523 RepID=UPI000342438C|nr:glycosyltransferase [Salinarchaeum sp. Harcht-Bsk1]AGN02686.1 dolichol-P-glucose transferase [Salinarchaeum sp. Harcht-Bsk1]
MQSSLGIVVPAYDPDVERMASYVDSLEQRLDPATIRIELDDPSGRVRERIPDDLPATVAVSATRRGKGAAITAGFEALDTDLYCFVDADGSTDVESVERVIDQVRSGGCDLAVGSRRHPEATVSNTQSQLRGTLGDGFAWIARLLLPVALFDYQCGTKAMDADSWAIVRGDLYEPGFGWDVNLVAAAGYHSLTVAEVPVSWSDHPSSTVDPLSATLTLGGALWRTKRHRLLGSTGRRPLLEQLADHE